MPGILQQQPYFGQMPMSERLELLFSKKNDEDGSAPKGFEKFFKKKRDNKEQPSDDKQEGK